MKEVSKNEKRRAWVEIFRGEYYSTTARFQNNRLQVPLIMTAALIIITFLFRLVFARFIELTEVQQEPSMQVYTVISVFSYIMLFVPLVSPLGKVFFDSTSWKYQSFISSTPIKARDILIGTFLSNLMFFLPFYGILGTISLSFMIGNGWISWWAVSLLLLVVLSLLITLGLLAGTILTPLIYTIIAKQRSNVAKAVITFALSVLMLGGVFLTLLYNNIGSPANLGAWGYLPSSLSANIIIYILYGINYNPGILASILFIVFSFIFLIIAGWKFSNQLYTLDDNIHNQPKTIKRGKIEHFVYSILAFLFGVSIAEIAITNLKLVFREIENLARLSLGISITIFLVYSLVGDSVTQSLGDSESSLKNALIFFSLTLGAGSMVYTEAANFTVSHKELFVLYKSSPKGASKFLIGKWIQMVIVQWFMAIIAMGVIAALQIASWNVLLSMFGILAFNLLCMSGLVIGIYALNPSDNEEDILNMINMIIFFAAVVLFGGIIASQFFFDDIARWQLFIPYVIEATVSIFVFIIGIKSFEQMDTETLDSSLRRGVLSFLAVVSVWLLSWFIFPLIGISLAAFVGLNIFGFTLAVVLPVVIPLMSKHRKEYFGSFKTQELKQSLIWFVVGLIGVFIVNLPFGYFIRSQSLENDNESTEIINSLLPQLQQVSLLMILILVGILAIIEEIFFRGYILEKLNADIGPLTAVVVSSILFAILHLSSWGAFFFSFLAGIIFSITKMKTGNLVAPIVIHYAYNVVILLLLI